jgi:hypothetical protein
VRGAHGPSARPPARSVGHSAPRRAVAPGQRCAPRPPPRSPSPGPPYYRDISTNSGFQFEFYCERCHDAWRSPFDRYAAGTLEGALGAAESLFGGFFGSARNAVSNITSAGHARAKDGALRTAVQHAAGHTDLTTRWRDRGRVDARSASAVTRDRAPTDDHASPTPDRVRRR